MYRITTTSSPKDLASHCPTINIENAVQHHIYIFGIKSFKACQHVNLSSGFTTFMFFKHQQLPPKTMNRTLSHKKLWSTYLRKYIKRDPQ